MSKKNKKRWNRNAIKPTTTESTVVATPAQPAPAPAAMLAWPRRFR
jgi:hypothetical protein